MVASDNSSELWNDVISFIPVNGSFPSISLESTFTNPAAAKNKQIKLSRALKIII
jgi:hypothetical protein